VPLMGCAANIAGVRGGRTLHPHVGMDEADRGLFRRPAVFRDRLVADVRGERQTLSRPKLMHCNMDCADLIQVVAVRAMPRHRGRGGSMKTEVGSTSFLIWNLPHPVTFLGGLPAGISTDEHSRSAMTDRSSREDHSDRLDRRHAGDRGADDHCDLRLRVLVSTDYRPSHPGMTELMRACNNH